MKTQTLKPLLARINSQLADILTKYETGQKQIAFDNSPAFDRFLNLSETVLPIMPKLTKPDFDSFSRLVNEFRRAAELHLNNPVFATCFVQLENFDQAARTKFENDFAPVSLNCRWETGFPFSLFMVTGEIPNWTANTFQKMFYNVQTLENPQGTITHQKRPKQGFDKFIELPAENHNLVPLFKAERPQNEIFDLLNFAEYQFIEFCQQSILKARQIKSHQEQLLGFFRLQAPKAHPGKTAAPQAGFDCSLTNNQLKKLCFALAQNCRFIDSSTNPDHFIAAFRPEPLPDGFEKIRWLSDNTELTYLLTDSLRGFITPTKQIWKQTDLVFADGKGDPLRNLRQAQNHRLAKYPELDRIVEKIML